MPEKGSIPFSVLIPFRNEEDVIKETSRAVIDRLVNTGYEFEVIWINDGSEDDSRAVLEQILPKDDSRFKAIETTGVGKKAALEIGYRESIHPIVLTIDADVIPQSGWPKGMVEPFISEDIHMICGDVFIRLDGSIQSSFEAIDTISLVGSARGLTQNGWAVMCNGANLAYRKSAYEEIGGFSQHAHISSGDDVFTLHRMMERYPQGVISANIDSVSGVVTFAQSDWKAVFIQRIRWAGKSSSYSSIKAKAVAALIGLISVCTVLGLLAAIWYPVIFVYALELWLGKAVIDIVLLWRFSASYKQKLPLVELCVQSLLYPFYTTIIAALSLFVKVNWKGRKITTR